jgi:hypothetical protein
MIDRIMLHRFLQRTCSAPKDEKTSASAEPRFFFNGWGGGKKNRGYAQAKTLRFEALIISVGQFPRFQFIRINIAFSRFLSNFRL